MSEKANIKPVIDKVKSLIRVRAGWNKKGAAPKIIVVNGIQILDNGVEVDTYTIPCMIKQGKIKVVYIGITSLRSILNNIERELSWK